MTRPSVSVVLCTYNRADSLRRTLESLRYLAYPAIEVVVVEGPCTDHTEEVLAPYEDTVKLVRTAERNVSASRNLGIQAASGEVVAFIDDDAVPDGRWLCDLTAAFADPEVAATGGPVFDNTGYELQARYSFANRWGDAWVETEQKRLDYIYHPDTWYFAYTIGTNSICRRERLVAIGGFDENYAFYLDETDLCLRLIDSGYLVVPQERGVVHHKFLPSAIRGDKGITFDRFRVILSRVYFALRRGVPESNELEMAEAFSQFVKGQRAELISHIEAGSIQPEVLARFDRDVITAWREGHERAAKPPLTRPQEWFQAQPTAFLPFPTKKVPGRRLRVCVVSQDFPPGAVAGIGRASHTLAVAMAEAGHLVHVITASDSDLNTVDLEDGVWVHRITSSDHGPPPVDQLPQRLWDRSASILGEVRRIDSFTPIDAVYLPNWDAEGLAVIREGRHRTCLYAYTPVLAVAEHDARLNPSDPAIRALAEAERMSYELADLVMVSFATTLEQLTQLYEVQIPAWKSAVVPLALPDIEKLDVPPHPGVVDILFVGRLELRKGIDTLLAAIPGLCARYNEIRFTIVGDDSIAAPDGLTYRQAFEAEQPPEVLARVCFTGPIPDDELMAAFASCDIFVAPSRFESFGLINLEAMRSRKPVVSTMVNGVASVVRDGEDGILVPPADPIALSAALARLIEEADRRAKLGANGRRSFEMNFNVGQLVERTVASIRALLEGRAQPSAVAEPQCSGPADSIHPLTQVAAERQRRLLEVLRCPHCRREVEVRSTVATIDGRVKTGRVLCRFCTGPVANITNFQVRVLDTLAVEDTLETEPTRIVGEVGEYRLTGGRGRVFCDGWDAHSDCWTASRDGASLIFREICTDVRLRVLDHGAGGVVEVAVDGAAVGTIDTRSESGSVSGIVDVATDLDLASHEVVVKVTKVQMEEHVVIQELVLLGPRGHGLPYTAPAPFARGNPYSDRILSYLNRCSPSQLILECGGGDRRPDRPNHVNLEFLPYEGADLFADTHCLPFDDNTFDVVLNQAVLEHVADPAGATQEMIRVCKPGGLILTEVAFMQPLHGVPYHFYNMTPWGVEELFKQACAIEESDWFGPLSFTMDWLLDAAGITGRLGAAERNEWRRRFSALDDLVDHESLRAVASGIWLVARKQSSSILLAE